MPNQNPLDSLEAIRDELIEMLSEINAILVWMRANQSELLISGYAYSDVLKNTEKSHSQGLSLMRWVDGNIDMDRRVISKPEVVTATLFSKNLRSLVRGSAQNFNSLANGAYLSHRVSSVRTKIRTFSDATKRSIHICDAIRALETE